jgi:hypothetical protein
MISTPVQSHVAGSWTNRGLSLAVNNCFRLSDGPLTALKAVACGRISSQQRTAACASIAGTATAGCLFGPQRPSRRRGRIKRSPVASYHLHLHAASAVLAAAEEDL